MNNTNNFNNNNNNNNNNKNRRRPDQAVCLGRTAMLAQLREGGVLLTEMLLPRIARQGAACLDEKLEQLE